MIALDAISEDHIKAALEDDIHRLQESFGGTYKKANTKFHHVKGTNIFIFVHSGHSACSSVLYSEFTSTQVISDIEFDFPFCCLPHKDHLPLEPFFRDNRHMLRLYKFTQLDREVEQLKVCERMLPSELPYRFSTGGGELFTHGHQFSEDIWTVSLKGYLDRFLPNHPYIELTYNCVTDFKLHQNGYTGLPTELC